MLLALLLLEAGEPARITFDLAKLKPSVAPCASSVTNEIVVCSSVGSRDRLMPVADRVGEGLPRAEIGLFGKVRGGIGVQQNNVGGFPSNRVMATVKIPF